MAAGSSNYWEDLRKQARQLENELDLKLVSFSKLCTSHSHSSARDGGRDSSDTTPLLNGSSQDRMFETMAIEIEQLLARLTGVNDKMAEYTNSAGVPSLNAALMHTLQRHRDILQDYTHEFHKTKANFMAIRERENLMGSVRKDIESYKSGSGVNNRRTELFLKEHDHLRNSDRLIEETIRMERSISHLQKNSRCDGSCTPGIHHPSIWCAIPPSSWDFTAGTTTPDSRAYQLFHLAHSPLPLLYNQGTSPFHSL
nr:Golgi SNAP receptor complex member 1 isoform X2 [Peromyscus maniculatus bairdii]